MADKRAEPGHEAAGAATDGQRKLLDRRGFLRGLGIGLPVLAGVGVSPPSRAEASGISPAPPSPLSQLDSAERDLVIRLQRDLERALQKPVEQRKWIMAIDLRKCTGCNGCVNACRSENALPPGVVYRVVIEEETGRYPNVSRKFLPRPCMQCDNPACVPVCPVAATYKRPDGVVAIDYDRCIGCRYCLTACPYGARTFDFGEYYTSGTPAMQPYETKRPSFDYGEAWTRQGTGSPIGNTRKCHFCLHRVEQGVLPACVTTCIGRATMFGDANDPQSLVSQAISRPSAHRLREELGTRPSVYYLE